VNNFDKINIAYGVTVLARGRRKNAVDGIGSYTYELLKVLSEKNEVNLQFYSFNEQFKNTAVLPKFDTQAAISTFTRLPFYGSKLINNEIDIFHSTDHLIPKLKNTPVVATIYDAIPLSNPEYIRNGCFSRVKTSAWKNSAKWAQHVITISEYSKQNIQKYFGIDENDITVTPLGVDQRWFNAEKNLDTGINSKYKLNEKYFVFIGTIQPRKNLERVIHAYLSLPAGVRSEVSLVVVGRNGWGCEKVVDALSSGKYGGGIQWLKYVPDQDIVHLLKNSIALVFPSLAEGFGLPVLEAFAAQVPVITSNTTSLPEVAGDAALMVHPLSVEEISNAMYRILDDEQLSSMLKAKGLKRARQFTWASTAEMTLDVYKKMLS
jgi:alpha-1,3-rhamnosyl/mannosyltransferase